MVVIGSGVPPFADTRCNPMVVKGAKTITSLTPHVPPRASTAGAIVSGAPPLRATFFSEPPEKKATQRLSGEKKWPSAPSVPDKAVDSGESSFLT